MLGLEVPYAALNVGDALDDGFAKSRGLRIEVHIERPRRDAGRFRKTVHSDSAETALAKALSGRVQDPLPRLRLLFVSCHAWIVLDRITIVIYVSHNGRYVTAGIEHPLRHRNPHMPLTLIVTEGVIPRDREQQTIARLSQAFLDLHGLSGNKALTPNVIGHIQVIAKGDTFAAMQPTPVAIIEWKVPAIAFASREVQSAYVEKATDIIHEASGGKHPREQTWVNVTHAVDGGWGIAGKAMTNAELGAAISQG